MHLEITLKNYRCFSDENPARFCLRDGAAAFIGPNNAGKSSLLRFFYEYRALFSALTTFGEYEQLLKSNRAFQLAAGVTDIAALFCSQNNRPITVQLKLSEDLNGDTVSPPMLLTLEQPRGQNVVRGTIESGNRKFGLPTDDGVAVKESRLHLMQGGKVVDGGLPLTPLVEVCKALSNTIYIAPLRNALNFGVEGSYFDVFVGLQFIERWSDFKTGPSRGNNAKALEVTEEVAHLFGIKQLEINASHDRKSLKLNVDNQPRDLAELGSGLSHFLVVMLNVAMRSPAFILIDEPENGLHPALQLDFLTRLEARATTGLVFASHSYGLARAAARDIFVVNSGPHGSTVKPVGQAPRLSEFLGELSYSAYREIGFDQILLVEGTTEVKVFQELLRKWEKDHKIVILPLGGNSLINGNRGDELAELHRITHQIKAVVDSERHNQSDSVSGTRADFHGLCRKLGIDCHVLDRRATENYLSDAAVKAVLGDKYKALAPFEALDQAPLGWSKNDNWKIARHMHKADFAETDLGRFLDGL